MTDTPPLPALPPQERLAQIADQLRDGWIRGRGPLTGLKALVAVRVEVLGLDPSPEYLELLDAVITAARTIASPRRSHADASTVLEANIRKLQDLCAATPAD
ncbi:MAG: hypothetical protein B7Y99_03640 [Caulobacterales bacterium 32-69-10]|nr:MAG: hypothetical protein B7Y99_03640 [Caulobacterales bacterium 32-69-10]